MDDGVGRDEVVCRVVVGRIDVNGGESDRWDGSVGVGRSDSDGGGDVAVVLHSGVLARTEGCVDDEEGRSGSGSGGGGELVEGGSR